MSGQLLAVYKAPKFPAIAVYVPNDAKTMQIIIGGQIQAIPIRRRYEIIICKKDAETKNIKRTATIDGRDYTGGILILGSKNNDYCSLNIQVARQWLRALNG